MPLDYMTTQTNVMAIRGPEDVTNPAENGAYVHGFYLEGSAWETGAEGQEGYLIE
jgi:dynein heavy chain